MVLSRGWRNWKAAWWEVRCGSLGKGLFHPSSMAGLEQRWPMVLALYCRKAERKREGRKRETGHSQVERGGRERRRAREE